jgi:hypothetical protein
VFRRDQAEVAKVGKFDVAVAVWVDMHVTTGCEAVLHPYASSSIEYYHYPYIVYNLQTFNLV